MTPLTRSMVIGVQYQILGEFSARSGGETVALGGPRQKLALALLVIEPRVSIPIDRLIDGVWGERPPVRARHTLQAYVSELRRVLGDTIAWAGGGYRIDVDPDRVDAQRFEGLVGLGRSRLEDDPARAADLLKEALDMWRGEPFSDLAYADSLQAEIHRLNQLRVAVVEDRVRADLAVGRHRLVLEELEALTREYPLRERLAGQFVLALYRDGRQAEALRALARTRNILGEELGVELSPELQDLEQRILDHDQSLLLARSDSVAIPPRSSRGFEMREEVGSGSVGVVFRSYQPSTGREVAVKRIHSDISEDPNFVSGFEVRGQVVTSLEHPHIAAVLDFWRDQSGAFVVMPWFDGGDLERKLEGGPLSLPATLEILDAVGAALSYSHRQGVFHGRVSPGNVLFDSEDNAYLSDFLGDVPSVEPGWPGLHSAAAGDVYGLGTLAHMMLSGSRSSPKSGFWLSNLRDDVPSALLSAIARSIDQESQDRFERVDDFIREIRRATGSDVVDVSVSDRSDFEVRNPYKGLRAFQELDADDFFGREDAVIGVLDSLRDQSLVALVGPSGSGKSSLVRAGVLPRIRSGSIEGSDTWLVTDMFPGAFPFEELVNALNRVTTVPDEGLFDDLMRDADGLLRALKRMFARGESHVLLLIDQFEELFSMVGDDGLRRLFLDNLAAAADDPTSGLHMIVTLRADYYDRPLEYHRFGGLMRKGTVSVAALSPEGLARAVSGPARNAGLDLEPGVVAEIVSEVEGEAGGLPLFQHALSELFEERDGNRLTIDAYRRTGGVVEALGRRAEELYQLLGTSEKSAAEQIFLRLVVVDEARQDSRRRVRRTELADLGVPGPTIDSVLRLFGRHRLLTFDHDPITRGATVEVAHEALLTKWNRLREWIRERRQDLVIQHRLQSAVREWEESGRDPGFLLTGSRLEQFDTFVRKTSLALTAAEGELLSASRADADQKRRRRKRRRGWIGAGLAGAALLASIFAVAALIQQRRAAAGEREAKVRAMMSVAVANIDMDSDLALLLAGEALDASRSVDGPLTWDAMAVVHQVLLATPNADVVAGGGRAVFSRDGRFLVTHEEDPLGSATYLWDPVSWELVGSLEGGSDATGLDVSPDSSRIATTHVNGPAIVWDTDTGRPVATLGFNVFGYLFPKLSPDGSFLVLSHRPFAPEGTTIKDWRPTTVSVFDVESGRLVETLEFPEGTSLTALSPDGSRFAVTSELGSVVVFETEGWTELFSVKSDGEDVVFTPDGSQLVTSGSPMIRFWNSTTGRLDNEIRAPADSIFRMAISPTGDRLAARDGEAGVFVIDAASGEVLNRFEARTAEVETLSFSPDGSYLASALNLEGQRLVTEIWDLRYRTSSGVELLNYVGEDDWAVLNAIWNADGSNVITSSFSPGSPDLGAGTWVFDSVTGEDIGRYPHELSTSLLGTNPPVRVIASPDGDYIVANRHLDESDEKQPGASYIIDAETWEVVQILEPGGVPGAFSADSSLLFVGDFDVGYVYETDTWTMLGTVVDPESQTLGKGNVFADGHFLSDRRHLITAGKSDRPGAAIWDPESWTVMSTASLGDYAIDISATSDGSLVSVLGGGNETDRIGLFRDEDLLRADTPAVEPVRTVEVSGNPLFAELSPDGSTLVTGGFDKRISLWSVETGDLLYRIDMGSVVSGVTFSKNGRRLLVAAEHGVTHLLTLDADELIQLARNRAARDLTSAECHFYLGPDACPSG